MKTMDLEKRAIAEKKATKPSDNVLTPKQTPSYAFGIGVAAVFLAINFLIATIYFGIINP